MDKKIEPSEIRRLALRRWLRIGLVAVGAVVAVAVIIGLFGGTTLPEAELTFAPAERGPLDTSVAASGRLTPAREEIVVSPVASRILAVYAQAGDSVKAGTPLIQLDLSDAEAEAQTLRDGYQIKHNAGEQQRLANNTLLSDLAMQVEIKEMDVARLAIEVDNERRLDSLGSGTGDRVRQAETALATGRLELDGLRLRLANERRRTAAQERAADLELSGSRRALDLMERTLSQGRIPAPHDGVITFLATSIGSTVSPGERLAVVGDLSRMKVTAEVPEGASFKVAVGAEATVRLGRETFAGHVANMEAQSVSGAVPFTVTLEDSSNPRLRPGLKVQVDVTYGFKEDVLRIPVGPFYEGPGSYNLFVRDGSTLHRRRVTLGESNSRYVEVTDGLAPGDEVVLSDLKEYERKKSIKLK